MLIGVIIVLICNKNFSENITNHIDNEYIGFNIKFLDGVKLSE